MSLQTKILSERERLGLTQKELAKKIGVTAVSVSRWERGEAKPRLDQIDRLARLCGRTVDWFMDEPSTAAPIGDSVLQRRAEQAEARLRELEARDEEIRRLLQKAPVASPRSRRSRRQKGETA